MQVSAIAFVKSPSVYLDQVDIEPVRIVRDGRTIAILAKPSTSETPVTDSLLGLLKGAGIRSTKDIKALRVKS